MGEESNSEYTYIYINIHIYTIKLIHFAIQQKGNSVEKLIKIN